MSETLEWRDLFSRGLDVVDPEIANLIADQRRQNRALVNLVASESYAPIATIEAEASELVNKNASGYPPRISFGGGRIIDEIERIAVGRARSLFGAEYANVQALSSTIANIAVLRALLRPGDRILAFSMASGGHTSHGHRSHISGQDYDVRTFGTRSDDGVVDYGEARRIAAQFRPQMIIAGSSSYPRALDFSELADIARASGALLFADIAHVVGLVIAGLHPNPTSLSAVVTTSTHKTLCGPRTGGLILAKAVHGAALDTAVSPVLQAAPGAHIMAARAVLFRLASQPGFTALMQCIVANAKALADGLTGAGMQLFAGGTDTHMVVLDLRSSNWNEAELNECLEEHGLVANTTHLPRRADGDGRLGLRLGTTPMSIRGVDAARFEELGRDVATILTDKSSPGAKRRISALANSFPPPYYG